MKTSFLLAGCILIATQSYALKKDPSYRDARRNGAMAKMELRIVNDDGVPIPYADVDVFMGMNFRPKGYSIAGRTDTNGVFIVKGKTCGDEIEIHASREGFYNSKRKICFAEMGAEHEVKDGKWMPYGGIELMRLREKRHPASLRQFAFTHRLAPATNVWIGVDMEVGDFVKPYGTGIESDFELNVEWDGLPPPDSRHCMASLRFSGKMSGAYYVNCIQESDYKYVYEAVKEAPYHEKVLKTVGRDSSGYVKHPDNVRLAVVRCRCTMDDDGKMKSACYGYIKAFYVDASWDGMPTLLLSGVFNPTPNDTNLEPK